LICASILIQNGTQDHHNCIETQEDEANNLPLNLQLAKEMRVVQQHASCILGAVFHGKGGDMGKRKKKKL